MDQIEIKVEPIYLPNNKDYPDSGAVRMYSEFSTLKTEPTMGTEMLVPECDKFRKMEEDTTKTKSKSDKIADGVVEAQYLQLNGFHIGRFEEDEFTGFMDMQGNSLKQSDTDIEKIVVDCVKMETSEETSILDTEKGQTSRMSNVNEFIEIGGTSHEKIEDDKTVFCIPYKLTLCSENKPHKCKICAKGFTTPYGVTKHQRVHTGEKPYTCKICNKSLYDYTSHKVHMRTHTGEKPYTCNNCNNSFSQKQHLREHVLIHVNQKPHSCEICKKTFRSTSSLRLHKRLHTGEKPYTCEDCDKSFSRLRTLRVHMRVHTGENVNKTPYTCAVCARVLNGISSFREHMRNHSDGKFSCDICGKKFMRLSELLHHRFTHTGEKPYPCEYCNKPFRRRATLRQHLMIHTGAKPFACDICGHAFKQSQHLKVHMTTHSGIKPYPCNFCDKAFTLKYRLRTHILTHMKTFEPIKEHEIGQLEIQK